jgi:hypothetical protein
MCKPKMTASEQKQARVSLIGQITNLLTEETTEALILLLAKLQEPAPAVLLTEEERETLREAVIEATVEGCYDIGITEIVTDGMKGVNEMTDTELLDEVADYWFDDTDEEIQEAIKENEDAAICAKYRKPELYAKVMETKEN